MRRVSIENANSLQIHTVFVSPLRRALETAYYVFKNHPNFNNINFIVVPKLREQLYGMSDFPNNIDETIKEFLPIFPNFNYDLFDEYEDRLNFFYVDLQQSIIDETRDKIWYLEEDPIKNNIADLLLKYTLQWYPEPFESNIKISFKFYF